MRDRNKFINAFLAKDYELLMSSEANKPAELNPSPDMQSAALKKHELEKSYYYQLSSNSPLLAYLKTQLLIQYYSQYNDTFNSFFKYLDANYKSQNMHLTTHDFFEHCLLYAANGLSSLSIYKDDISFNITYRLPEHLPENPSLFTFSYEYREEIDERYINFLSIISIIEDEMKNIQRKENESFYFLKEPKECVSHRKLKGTFVLNLKPFIEIYVQNPIFVAEKLLQEHEGIADKNSIHELANYLTKEIEKFKSLNKGISPAYLDNLIERMALISQEKVSIASNSIFRLTPKPDEATAITPSLSPAS